jgi:phage N-6-adenine-methyltransferase
VPAQNNHNGLWKSGGAGFCSKSDDWATPPHVYTELAAEFSFTLDASASADNAKCGRYFTVDDNGLSKAWAPETVWVNPPYARGITGLWLEKAADEAESGATVVALVPARTDTAWWHDQVMARAAEVRLVRGLKGAIIDVTAQAAAS